MSLSFPEFRPPACLTWNYPKRPKYATVKQTPQSFRRAAKSTVQRSVVYELELAYEFLRNPGKTYDDDAAYIQNFYEAVRGGYGYFTFDPSAYNLEPMNVFQDVTAMRSGFFGIGDGITAVWPLWRSTNVLTPVDADTPTVTQLELIQCVRFAPQIYINGAAADPSSYSLSNFPAQVSFLSPPGDGTVLSWEGGYSYLCEFAEDQLDIEEFLYQWWELKSLKLNTVLL